MNPLISILLPVYNASIFVNACLRSIQNQSFTDFETIIIDDGSTDGTYNTISKLIQNDQRFKLFRFQENRGIVAALNEGLEKCCGFWIARMDIDDIMHPDRLMKQLSFMTRHPDIDIQGTQVRLIRDDAPITDGQHNYINWSNQLVEDKTIKQEIFAESPIIHPTFFLSRNYYSKLGNYQDNPWVEDYDFLLRAFNQGAKFGKIAEKLLIKRDHPQRVVRNDIRCKRKAMFAIKTHYFKKSNWFDPTKKLLIIGTGAVGKMLATALMNENIQVDGFINNDHSNKKGTLKGLPIYFLNEANAKQFFAEQKNTFYISAVGVPDGKKKVNQLLQQYQLKVAHDYLKFI
ncbi:MAG: glycosyltransferase [Deltaproteobacteria bacterium]|jgi:glycosyltransferase involved in cell wall biosynthesis|nr:glycosyltransferase [Deltaproteobacteria bacterium]